MTQGVYIRTKENNNALGKHWKLSEERKENIGLETKKQFKINSNMGMRGKKHTEKTK